MAKKPFSRFRATTDIFPSVAVRTYVTCDNFANVATSLPQHFLIMIKSRKQILNHCTLPDQKHYTVSRNPDWSEAMRKTFFYSTINELNALNLEPTTSFSLMKTTLTNNAASNYTVDNFKVKKLFWFLKIRAFFKYHCRLDSLFYQCIHFRF